MTSMRFKVKIRDVPPHAAARVLGLSLEAFRAKLPDLMSRRFPGPDPTTGHFDLEAIERWQNQRNSHLFHQNDADIPSPSIRARLRMVRP